MTQPTSKTAVRGCNHTEKEIEIVATQSLDKLMKMMEEMAKSSDGGRANAPKEEYGKRQPGETCAYERDGFKKI